MRSIRSLVSRSSLIALLGLFPLSCEPARDPGIGDEPEKRTSRNVEKTPSGPKRVSFTLHHRIRPGRKTESLRYTIVVPRNLEGRQVIRELTYSMPPGRMEKREGNSYAVYQFNQPREPITIDIRVTADVFPFDLTTATERSRPSPAARAGDPAPTKPATSPPPVSNLSRWLVPEKRLEANDPAIRALARQATAADPIEQARQLMDLVRSTLRYTGHGRGSKGALGALAEKSGDCTEFSDLFVTLCRARGLPARTCDGILVLPVKPGDTPKHSWAEFFVPDLGWIPIDPLMISLGNTSFDRRPNAYVQLSQVRNDILLDSYSFDAYHYQGDPVQVEASVTLHEVARPR